MYPVIVIRVCSLYNFFFYLLIMRSTVQNSFKDMKNVYKLIFNKCLNLLLNISENLLINICRKKCHKNSFSFNNLSKICTSSNNKQYFTKYMQMGRQFPHSQYKKFSATLIKRFIYYFLVSLMFREGASRFIRRPSAFASRSPSLISLTILCPTKMKFSQVTPLYISF